jgi:hypothetical protein
LAADDLLSANTLSLSISLSSLEWRCMVDLDMELQDVKDILRRLTYLSIVAGDLKIRRNTFF